MPFIFRGESIRNIRRAVSGIGFLAALGIALIISLKLVGILLGLGILMGVFLLLSRSVKKVYFNEDSIRVTYYLLREDSTILYSDVLKIYLNPQGRLPDPVYVILYRKDKKKKKATFFCSEKEFKSFSNVMSGRIKILAK